MKSSIINIDGNKIPTLLAVTDAEQQIGLMYRKDLPPSMSFVYAAPKINKFWMKSTPCALDIVFCSNGKVIDIYKGEPLSTSIIGPDIPTDLVVELPYGTCKKIGVKAGSIVNVDNIESLRLFTNRYY